MDAASTKNTEYHRLVVTLHNLVNVPQELIAASKRGAKHAVEIECDTSGCHPVVGNFSSSDLREMHGHLEVAWEPSNQQQHQQESHIGSKIVQSPMCSREWTPPVRSKTLHVIVTVTETARADGDRRTLGAPASLSVNIESVLQRKVVTRIIGTSTGQVGVSFTVSPADVEGYRARLEAFLQKHNPAGLTLVPSVVSSVSEIETFNKVFKKYGVVDYEQRVRFFFEMYGPEHIAAIPSTLKEWEHREEELLRSLILDNGPEPDDIDLRLRLLAFVERHNITDLDVDNLVIAHRDNPAVLFASLTSQYGPEPDPRTYLYPAVFYAPEQGSSVTSRPATPTPSASAAPQRLPVVDRETLHTTSSQPNLNGHYPPSGDSKRASNQGRADPTADSMAPAAQHSAWPKFCDDLRRAGIPPAELFYLSEQSFKTLLDELGCGGSTQREWLLSEWHRRVKQALVQSYLSSDDSSYETARREAVALSGLPPLSVHIVGVMRLQNAEHEASFNLRLAAAKVRAVERLLFVGEFNELLSFATYGFAPTPNHGKAIAFKKKPFFKLSRPTTISALICDVIVGKSLLSVMDPPEPDENFFATYDSATGRANTDNQATIVYQPHQILPRYLVHCTVDPTVIPCPSHPARAVEFYIPEASVFACAQCAVLGEHRHRTVLSLDDAASQAQMRLTEVSREARFLRDDLASQEREVERALEQLPQSEEWLAAKREADAILREAELRAAEVLREAERRQSEQQQNLMQTRQALRDVVGDVGSLLDQLTEGGSLNGAPAIQLLSRVNDARLLEVVREKVAAARRSTSHHQRPPLGAGLSRTQSMTRVGDLSNAPPLARTTSVQSQGHHHPHHSDHGASASDNSDLFSKFAALKGGGTAGGTSGGNVRLDHHRQTSSALSSFSGTPPLAAAFSSHVLENVRPEGQRIGTETDGRRSSKELMARGWAAYRGGDKATAQQIWSQIFERNPHNAVGARARAYLAEAIDRDYTSAATWYEKALQVDPSDCMTLFNYAVLLESVMGRKDDALELFDAAARLGDHTAARRAQQLRQQIAS